MLQFFYQALQTKYGLRLSTSAPQQLIQKLHAARAKAQDGTLKKLIVCISRTNPDGEVWIVNPPEQARAQEES